MPNMDIYLVCSFKMLLGIFMWTSQDKLQNRLTCRSLYTGLVSEQEESRQEEDPVVERRSHSSALSHHSMDRAC